MTHTTSTMPTSVPLRTTLLVDAVGCLLSALLLTLAADVLARWTGIDRAIVWNAGLLLLPVSAWIALVALRLSSSTPAVMSVVIGNGAWVVASVVVWWVQSPTLPGTLLVLGQAVAVLLIAALEFIAARGPRDARSGQASGVTP